MYFLLLILNPIVRGKNATLSDGPVPIKVLKNECDTYENMLIHATDYGQKWTLPDPAHSI